MQRFLVVLLAAFDAVIAVAVGVVVALAPLALIWVFALGSPVWDALWPAAGTVWQLGHLVPLTVTLPDDYLAQTGIESDAAAFALSLAPLAFTAFTAIFAARSGARAAQAGAWVTGTATGTAVVAVLSALIALTTGNGVVSVELWQAILFPTLVFAVPALVGAVVAAWRDGDGGIVDAVHDRVDAWPAGWREVPGLVVRGSGIALAGLVGLGALAVAAAVVMRGGEVIALFETGHLDALGATVVTLAQLAYLPTLVVWGLSFVAGPGFAIGTGTAVSPVGTQLGVLPGIPALGLVPESTSPWLLALVLLPIAVGGLAGWAVRARLAALSDEPDALAPRRIGVLVTLAAGIAALTAAVAALLAHVAAGSLGPGRLAEVGPAAGPLALVVGVEVLVGASIALLTARVVQWSPDDGTGHSWSVADPDGDAERPARLGWGTLIPTVADRPVAVLSPGDALGAELDAGHPRPLVVTEADAADLPLALPAQESTDPADADHAPTNGGPDDTDTAPIDLSALPKLPRPDPATLPDPSTLGPNRPSPLPPVD